ncbi:MAG: prepilin peptidase [Betaproteobacteria bacterium]|nr:prepilin peptidase [Betaproteobacteria bacterium]
MASGDIQSALWPLWSPVGLLLLGLCVGSFINVVVRRLPLMMGRHGWRDTAAQLQSTPGSAEWTGPVAEDEAALARRLAVAQELHARLNGLPDLSLVHPRSHCPGCGHVLAWHENLPLLGWLRLRGRCSACGMAIGWRMPLVELFTGLLFWAMGLRFGFEPIALLWGAWGAALATMALIDWDTTWLPDALTLPLLWSGLVVAALGWTLPLSDAIWGSVWGYLGLWVVVAVFERIVGQEAMGGGDLKLLAALGAWLGPAALLPLVFIASCLGAVVGLVMKSQGVLREGRFVPFGPFLALGGAVVACWEAGPWVLGVGG